MIVSPLGVSNASIGYNYLIVALEAVDKVDDESDTSEGKEAPDGGEEVAVQIGDLGKVQEEAAQRDKEESHCFISG
jgi:hypothetical protein